MKQKGRVVGIFSKFIRKKSDAKEENGDQKGSVSEALAEISIKMSEFNINDLFEDLADTLTETRSEENITLLFETAKDVPSKVIGDRKHLGLVLQYLLENAIDFTAEGEVKLKIERQYSNLNEIHFRFKVLDSGVGIHPEAVKEILTPFFKGEIYSLSELGIEGEGLFYAREILKKMKGKLSVTSTEGKGSTFVVDVSLFATDPLNKRHYRLPDEASRLLRVKIFDIDHKSAEGLTKLFEYFRHTVSAPNLHHLNALSGINDYDLIIIPDKLINEKIMAQIKAIKLKKSLELVLISDRKVSVNEKVLELADAQIFKPFNQQMIYELLIDLSAVNPVKE